MTESSLSAIEILVRLGELCRPGMEHVASRSTAETFDSWLVQLRTSRLPDRMTSSDVRATLLTLPELDVDDPHDPRFYCSLAVGVISDGLELLDGGVADEVLGHAESRVLEFYSALGVTLERADPTLEAKAERAIEAVLDATDPPSSQTAGALADAEQGLSALLVGND